MPGVTQEQVAAARKLTAIEYLQRYMPDELVRCGRGEYQLRSHDSFKINAETSLFHMKICLTITRSSSDLIRTAKPISPPSAELGATSPSSAIWRGRTNPLGSV